MKRIHSGTWLAIVVAAVLLLFDVPLSVGEEGSRPEAPAGARYVAGIDLHPFGVYPWHKCLILSVFKGERGALLSFNTQELYNNHISMET